MAALPEIQEVTINFFILNTNQAIFFSQSDVNFVRLQRRRLRDEMDPFEMAEGQFIRLFRLNAQSVINLVQDLLPHIPNRNNNAISLTQKVLITLHFLAVGSFQNSVGSNAWVSVSQTTVSRVINEICSVIAQHLLPICVRFPTTNEQVIVSKQEFLRIHGMRGIVGAIDGTHVEILTPPTTGVNNPPYVERKGKENILSM
ncbi:hypothetical protein RI129_009712 [Pyrocoelia pectoralis]|uniref:Nuclease HARBI1 n=1 Tax=Pyrocoelia pectoralis TaxID=417401 RepID=A0AAN7ZCH2_9COLE